MTALKSPSAEDQAGRPKPISAAGAKPRLVAPSSPPAVPRPASIQTKAPRAVKPSPSPGKAGAGEAIRRDVAEKVSSSSLGAGFMGWLGRNFPSFFARKQAAKSGKPIAGGEIAKANQRIPFQTVSSDDALQEMSIDGEDFIFSGKIKGAETIRSVMALLSNGLLVVAKGYENDRAVMSAISAAGHRGISILRKISVDLEVITEYQKRRRSASAPKETEENEVRKEILAIIREAVAIGASDIHISIDSRKGLIEIRSDGVLRPTEREIPVDRARRLCAAVFPMCDAADATYDELKPQGARITGGGKRGFELPAGLQALRVQWDPLSYGGRYMILRLLYAAKSDTGNLIGLGFAPEQVATMEVAVERPVGMVYITGPTGSGKSTTLQRAMRWLITKTSGELNALTIEDPPEYVILGAKQIPVTNANTEEERRAAFTAAIVAAMRSDPDVIMIGEVRDRESARLACQAGLTGHRVFTTLHVNDAISIPDRLRDIGVEDYKIYDPSLVSAFVGQRLARLLCQHCRMPLGRAIDEGRVDNRILERLVVACPEIGRDSLRAAVHVAGDGCVHCGRRKGYGERSVLAEVIGPDARLMDLLREGKKLEAWRYWKVERNGLTLIGHGLSKVLAGAMSPFEVERVVGPVDGDQKMLASLAASELARHQRLVEAAG